MKNIKQLLPKVYTKYHQGYINPIECKKIFPELRNIKIIYRSSYEFKFIQWCESMDWVKYWGSECLSIPYYYNNIRHIYWPDFVILDKNNHYWLIEIKSQMDVNNVIYKKQNNNFVKQVALKNKLKWAAAIDWCNKKGPNWTFKVVTESQGIF